MRVGSTRRAAWIAALFLAPSIAIAQQARNEALVRGSALLESMNAIEAIPLLEQATRENAGPLAHFNLGLAYRAVGRYRDALRAWDSYLEAPETDAPAERLNAIRAERDELVRRCLRVELRWSPREAIVRIDGQPQPAAEHGAAQWLLDASAREIEVSAARYRPFRAALPGRAGVVRFDVRLLPIEQTIPPLARLERRVPWWTWIGVGVAATSAVAAAVLTADGQRIYSDCASNTAACASDQRGVQAALDARSTGIAVSVGVGAAGLFTVGFGVAWMFFAPPIAQRTR